MRTFEELKNTIETGLGKYPCDLCLANVQLVNVYSEEVYPTNIYIKNGRIVSIAPETNLKSDQVVDCQGLYAIPGLVDAHTHFESTMLSPEALASCIVPKGTTTICADMMEIANVAGKEGLKVMLEAIRDLPYRCLIEVSSVVPAAPGLETTGAILGPEEILEIMDWEESISLGELDPSKIFQVNEPYIQKIANALQKGKLVNGHGIGRLGHELNVYASAGIIDDHECVTGEEMLERLRVGMSIFVREGSSEKNLEPIIKTLLKKGLSYENFMFCTDDKHANEIVAEGHINYNVNKAIALHVPPIRALQMASVNAARHFRREDDFGSIAPGRSADILLVHDLKNIQPVAVYFKGQLVAENNRLTKEYPVMDYPEWILNTVHLLKPITKDSFILPTNAKKAAKVHVMELVRDQIINHDIEVRLPVQDRQINMDPSRDILKLAVVERYGKNGNIGVGFVKGFGLQSGAMAYSMSHDHHNIVVVGTSESDMAAAVQAVADLKGGLAVVKDSQVKAAMELPIGGLMSLEPADQVMEKIEEMNAAAQALGCPLTAPFMDLSFVSLPTVPDLGLTDKGLVDAYHVRFMDLEVPDKP